MEVILLEVARQRSRSTPVSAAARSAGACMPRLFRCFTPTTSRLPRSARTLGCNLLKEPESSIHGVTVRKRAGNVGLQEDQVRARDGPLIVLAPYATLQAREIVLGAQVVTASRRQSLSHTVFAPCLSLFPRRVIRVPEREC